MRVEIDSHSGFCFGVVTAIGKAEQAIASGCKVLSLGDIVHNAEEQRRLEDMGLRTIDHSGITAVDGETILVRAHGEPPSTYAILNQNNIPYIDATCPVVARLQKRVKEAYEQMSEVGGQVVILGKRGHAEVVGLSGQINDDCIVVESTDDLHLVDFSRPITLLSQTTQSLELFSEVADEIRRRSTTPDQIFLHDTVCRQVANREQLLRDFAQRFDVVIFVCGRKSSNGKVLYGVCHEANPRSYCVENEGEIEASWLANAESVGVCGATSTPAWLMERVAKYIETL
ncbi:MAG: 4-hydroxy-3-methylbut-2-enyl diphosphate reductase [Rikenellaceae bacterium]|nr:4-hydroxy-3-methylbut-2-enyl diphosphate reductase [Rikenellaceae bacterium]MBR2452045.1 4-hydroxy-3-methylbut-2-enyl diphosphate reductase [Rikenellaceae bacterium]